MRGEFDNPYQQCLSERMRVAGRATRIQGYGLLLESYKTVSIWPMPECRQRVPGERRQITHCTKSVQKSDCLPSRRSFAARNLPQRAHSG